MNRRLTGCLLVLALSAAPRSAVLRAQSSPPVGLPAESDPLTDLRGFVSPSPSWRIVGGVEADRTREQLVGASPGRGILLDDPSAGRAADLFTAWRHGDLQLDLDFLMPRGSNSGVYLQGRYEVQLLDSWGVPHPGIHDSGAIYERWDASRPVGSKGFEGIPPRLNASRAPGLWQHLSVDFRAPRFDARGRKVENARFERVVLNGVVIHENVEVTGPTRGSAFALEAPEGPLRIQGDHGPVAFRNLRFRRFGLVPARLSDLRYRVYEGDFHQLGAAVSGPAVREGAAAALVPEVAGVPDRYAVAYEGTLQLPASGRYRFDLRLGWIGDDPGLPEGVGAARLEIDGRVVISHAGRENGATGEAELKAGRHAVSVSWFRNFSWVKRRDVQLFVEGPGLARQALHAPGAPPPPPPDPVHVALGGSVTVQRSFIRFGAERRTHAVSVGDPAGVHYSYDLERGALLQAWRGPFVDATEMWRGRGNDQVATPLGIVLLLSSAPTVAALSGPQAAWPDSVADPQYRFEGYSLDKGGRPTFRYRLDGAEITDRLVPDGTGPSLRREIEVNRARGGAPLYARLAVGREIRILPDGSYAVDDFRYYVVPGPGPAPVVRSGSDGQELWVPLPAGVGSTRIGYQLIW